MNPRHDPSEGRCRPQPGRLNSLFAATVLVSAAVLAHALWDGREQVLRQAQAHGSTLADLLASRAAATLQRVDADLARLAGRLPTPGQPADGAADRIADIDALLADQVAGIPELVRIVVLGTERDLIYSSDAGLAGEADLVEHRVASQAARLTGRDTDFSEVFASVVDRRAAIVVTRPWTAPDGRFLGTVHALFDLARWQQLIESVNIGGQGAVAVRRRDDNRLLLRFPQAFDQVNRSLDSPMWRRIAQGDTQGTLRVDSALDGVARVQSFRALEDHPFYVMVAIAHDDVLAGWRRSAWRTAAIAGVALAAFGILLGGLHRAERRRNRALDKLARRE